MPAIKTMPHDPCANGQGSVVRSALMQQLDISDRLLDIALEMAEAAEKRRDMAPAQIESHAEKIYESAIDISRLVRDMGSVLSGRAL